MDLKTYEIKTEEEAAWEEAALAEEQEDSAGFTIDTPELANWAFKKIKAMQQEIQDKKDFAQREKEKIDAWLEKETTPDQDSINFFENHLIQYYKRLQAEDPKAKLTTPNGKVQSRKRQPKWEFKDEPLIEYLKQTDPDKLETQYKYNKAEMKKQFKILDPEKSSKVVDENGELIDFITVTPQEPSYTVKVED